MTPRRVPTFIYTLALGVFPPGHRATYGNEMIEVFERELAARRADGHWRVLRFIVAACIDALGAGFGERRRCRHHVGPGYFEAFEKPIVSGRGLNDGDRTACPRRVLVNESFARRFLDGRNPVGRRVRYAASDGPTTEPWLEIVGMVRDVGMTPTNLGEAPYVFHAASPATSNPLVMGVRTTGDPAALVPRARAIAAALDAGLRLDTVQPLEDVVWSQDVPMLAVSGGVVGIITLGLLLSAVGIFSLMSVSVAQRTREIGLRAALGATQTQLLGGIFSRAIVLVGSGVAAGNAALFGLSLAGADLDHGRNPLIWTSAAMLIAALLACIEPARRALRIQPTAALKDV